MTGLRMIGIFGWNVNQHIAHGQPFVMTFYYSTALSRKIIFVPQPHHLQNPTVPSRPLMETTSQLVTASTSIQEIRDVTRELIAHTSINAPDAQLATQYIDLAPIQNPPPPLPPQQSNQNNPSTFKNSPDHSSPIITPIKPDRLQYHLHAVNYNPTLTQYLVDGFTYGFSLENNSSVTNKLAKNNIILNLHPEVARQKISEEVRMGRMAGPFEQPPFEQFHISPLSLREKKSKGKFRLIHNLSHPYDGTSINHNIPDKAKKVHYHTVGDAIKILLTLPHAAFTAKTDICDAYRLVPIHPSDYPKLGIFYDGKYFYDKHLPQGCASSCQIFEKFSTAVQAIFTGYYKSAHCLHMIDDFLILAPDKHTCQFYLDKLLSLCKDLGIPMSPEKTTPPSCTTTFLGIQLDTINQAARLPIEKLTEYVLLVQETLQKKKITRHNLESLLGKFNFAASVVPARPFLRRLFDLMKPNQKPYYFIHLSSEAKQDLHTWLHFLSKYNGITYFRSLNITPQDPISMSSDASHLGFGACFGKKWIQCEYPTSWRIQNITLLELYPIYVAIEIFGQSIKNSNVLFHTDNSAVKDIVNNQTSKHKTIMKIIRPLILSLVNHNINLRATHIPGTTNILPDAISRFQVNAAMLQHYQMENQPTPIPAHLHPNNFKL